MKFTIDTDYPPRHSLTAEEINFLQKLAAHKLPLDKSLVFQINDLQRHTGLVLSGDLHPDDSIPDTAKMEREVEDLDKLIDEYKERLEGDDLSQEERAEAGELLALWETQRAALKMALGNPARNTKPHPPLGVYSNNGNNSRVTLFVDAIRNNAKDPDKAMLLMAQVLLHEYFHSFYSHAGIGENKPLSCMEEPMAEFGSLAFLLSVSSSRSSVAGQARDAMRYAIELNNKKRAAGSGAAYKYGVYLFENFCGYSRDIIARYANVSCLLDGHSKEAVEYKYLLYPTYPTSSYIEDVVLYGKLEELMAYKVNPGSRVINKGYEINV